jgi:hypothetical protein
MKESTQSSFDEGHGEGHASFVRIERENLFVEAKV